MYLDKEFKEFGINSSQHMFIKKICANEGISQDDLYTLMYVNKSNITRALVQLEDKGFIERVKNPADKRSILLYPTDKAKDICEKIHSIENEWINIIESELNDEDRKQIEHLVKKIGKTAIEYLDLNKTK